VAHRSQWIAQGDIWCHVAFYTGTVREKSRDRITILNLNVNDTNRLRLRLPSIYSTTMHYLNEDAYHPSRCNVP